MEVEEVEEALRGHLRLWEECKEGEGNRVEEWEAWEAWEAWEEVEVEVDSVWEIHPL